MRPKPIEGKYFDDFWKYVSEGEFRLQQCSACGTFVYPPGPSCPVCFEEHLEWTPVSGTGKVISWARFHRTYFPDLPAPYTVVAVELDEGPIVIFDVMEGEERIQLGSRARAVIDRSGDYPIPRWSILG